MITGGILCFSCDVTFAKPQTFLENVECQICLSKQVQGVKRDTCHHAVCLTCFKKAHYGDPPPRPVFPYEKEIEMDFMENEWDERWFEDPLIRKYQNEHQAWVEKLYANFKECDPMRTCAECK